MKVLVEGHKYELEYFEDCMEGCDITEQTIQFIEKVPAPVAEGGEPDGSLFTMNNGTTNEDVLDVLIDRMKYLQAKFPCRENAIVITNLEESLMWLNKRTADRSVRGVEGKQIK